MNCETCDERDDLEDLRSQGIEDEMHDLPPWGICLDCRYGEIMDPEDSCGTCVSPKWNKGKGIYITVHNRKHCKGFRECLPDFDAW